MKLDPESGRSKGTKGDGRRAIVLLVMMLVIAACAVTATTAQPPPPQQQMPQQQAQQSTAAALPVDPLLGLTVVQAALLGALVGVLAGGVVTFFVQTRLDKNRRAEVEQRLAYAQLVQVTVFAAGTRTALDRIASFGDTALPASNKKLQDAVDRDEIPKPVAWCAVIASKLDDRQARNVIRPMIGLFGDSTASFNESLTAMQIRGKDFADMAPQVIAAHSAAVKEIAGCTASFKSLTAAFANSTVPSDVLGRLALATWDSMNRLATTLEALRQSLIPPSKVTATEAARMYADLEALAATSTETGITSNMAFDRAMALLRAQPGQ